MKRGPYYLPLSICLLLFMTLSTHPLKQETLGKTQGAGRHIQEIYLACARGKYLVLVVCSLPSLPQQYNYIAGETFPLSLYFYAGKT